MKKLLAVILSVALLTAMTSAVALADDDLNVSIAGIKNAEIIGSLQKKGVNYYLVEKGGWTWIVSAFLDVVTGVDSTGGEWNAETLELSFDDGMTLYPANWAQVLFNLTDMGAWEYDWNS